MFAVDLQASDSPSFPHSEPTDPRPFYIFFKLYLLIENLAGSIFIKMATELWYVLTSSSPWVLDSS